MPIKRPTLAELITTAQADIDAALAKVNNDSPWAGSRLPQSLLTILAKAVAGLAHGLYGYIDYLWRQCFVTSAEGQWLDLIHGKIWGITRKQASQATGTATLAGATGSLLPAGTLLQRADGNLYEVIASVVAAEGQATVQVKALGVGLATNASSGTQLTLVNPALGFTGNGVVISITGGAEIETDEEYRGRLLKRIQNPPQGGSEDDWEQWTLEVAGVTRVFATSRPFGGTSVGIQFMMDNTYDDGLPEAGDVATVLAYLQALTLKPITSELFVSAPTAHVVNFNIQIAPNTAEVRTAVEAEIKALFRREATPSAVIPISHVREVISTALGEGDHVLTSPTTNITPPTGAIPVVGAFTFSAL